MLCLCPEIHSNNHSLCKSMDHSRSNISPSNTNRWHRVFVVHRPIVQLSHYFRFVLNYCKITEQRFEVMNIRKRIFHIMSLKKGKKSVFQQTVCHHFFRSHFFLLHSQLFPSDHGSSKFQLAYVIRNLFSASTQVRHQHFLTFSTFQPRDSEINQLRIYNYSSVNCTRTKDEKKTGLYEW